MPRPSSNRRAAVARATRKVRAGSDILPAMLRSIKALDSRKRRRRVQQESSMKVYSLLRAAGTAIWIGGQLFAVVALPSAAEALPRRKDRRRVVEAGWDAWTP